jgi:hypothetical protein
MDVGLVSGNMMIAMPIEAMGEAAASRKATGCRRSPSST